ncbi:hypothetical protein IQ216_06385 [Cyanobium sp. LEGE 06143]|uniref:hypothetical protein n=1 Tax=Cyanobium sp. LEGE 06143 TaxID=945727 RepID=UPI0018823FDD|nr:hypothetical protein [Cyanobium sp. LEGE 06143]MBE9172727.1 hypothetical protein [Cyanobium sp. LEGE 06143]
MRDHAVIDVLDVWIADRRLSRRKLAFLETVYDQALEDIPQAYSVDIAGHDYCSELDLPSGSLFPLVVAGVLDHLKPLDEAPCRLVEMAEKLVRCQHLSREEAEAVYAAAL